MALGWQRWYISEWKRESSIFLVQQTRVSRSTHAHTHTHAEREREMSAINSCADLYILTVGRLCHRRRTSLFMWASECVCVCSFNYLHIMANSSKTIEHTICKQANYRTRLGECECVCWLAQWHMCVCVSDLRPSDVRYWFIEFKKKNSAKIKHLLADSGIIEQNGWHAHVKEQWCDEKRRDTFDQCLFLVFL